VTPVLIATAPVPNAELCPTLTVPPFRTAPPTNVLFPLNAMAPVPPLTNPPAPLTIPERTVAAFAVTVSVLPCRSNVPLNVNALAAVTVAFAVTVPGPLNVNAPVFVTSPNVTLPPIWNPLGRERAVAESLERAPPVSTRAPPANPPNAASFPMFTLPADNNTPPVKVLFPLNVNVALPLMVNRLDCKLNELVPTPAKLPIVSLLASLNVPVVPTVTAPPSGNALPPDTVNVPSFTAVAPENVFVPLNVNSPAPSFVKPNAPPNPPLRITGLNTVNVRSCVNVPAPPNVICPFFVPSPIVAAAPENVYEFEKTRAAPLSLEITPAPIVIVPVPNAPSFPA
jgi:hypothetical protein